MKTRGMKRAAGVAMGIAALIVAGGCQQPARAGKPAKGGSAVAAPGGSKPATTTPGASPAPTQVVISTLREKAIGIVEETAKAVDPAMRANAVGAAWYAPVRLRSIIESGLQDPNPGVRAVAASVVGHAKLAGFTPQLQSLASDSQSVVKVSAIYALAANRVPVDRTPLAEVLMNDPSASAKRQTVDALGMLGDSSAIPLLKAAAKQKFPELSPAQSRLLQLQIAEALVKLGDDAQRPVIRAALYPSQPDELEATVLAVQSIGAIKDKEAAAQLVGLIEYRDRAKQQYPAEVRLAIAATLAQLGMPEGSFVADQYVQNPAATVRVQAAFVYGHTKGKGNGARLSQLMDDPDQQVRVAAAGAVLMSLAGR
ncbi:MAG: HEAT repeat domain-containing protein [Phycisphaerales bacterium]